ncbi:MAG: hypothetical protein ABSC48_15195 [Terracidiphilus sp.]|jgi:hypothetical protein
MRKSNYRIHVTADSVDVECDNPLGSPRSPRFFGVFVIADALALLCLPWFVHGHGSTMWVILTESRPSDPGFVESVITAVLAMAIGILLLAWGIRYCLPFGERLHCDRSMLTWSKIRWISFRNRWVTRSIPVSEIVRASYGIVYKSKGVYGILLENGVDGEPWKLFWGIETPEANRILRGLKALGVNVYIDPEMREVIRETLRDRSAQL